MSAAVLIHAVAPARSLPVLPAASPVDGARLSWIVEGDLAALASLLPAGPDDALFGDPERSAALSLRHHALLTEIGATLDLAPVRLGAVCSDVQSARALLQAEAPVFAASLARIAGRHEYAVKLVPMAEIVPPAAPAPPADGRSYLQRRAAEAEARRRSGEAARAAAVAAFDALKVHAAAHVFLPPRRHAAADQERRLLDAAMLVSRAEVARFSQAVIAAQAAADAAGFALSVRGPLPAYSFVAEAA
jgi:hypothetical protein